jgi:hypothetical protein
MRHFAILNHFLAVSIRQPAQVVLNLAALTD